MSAEFAAPAFRFIAIGAAMFAFGGLTFSVLGKLKTAPPRLAAILSLAASVGSAALWARGILGATISPEKLSLLIGATFIGKAWLIHISAAAIVAVYAFQRSRRQYLFALLAAASLATFAPIGHAAAADGGEKTIRILLQSMHLLGAGFWIGALPLLVRQLAGGTDDAARAVAIFAKYASIAVFALVAAAIANLFFLTGGEALSFKTEYGRILALKAGLVIAAILLAAFNRFSMTPQRQFGVIAKIALMEIVLLLIVVAEGVRLAASAPWR